MRGTRRKGWQDVFFLSLIAKYVPIAVFSQRQRELIHCDGRTLRVKSRSPPPGAGNWKVPSCELPHLNRRSYLALSQLSGAGGTRHCRGITGLSRTEAKRRERRDRRGQKRRGIKCRESTLIPNSSVLAEWSAPALHSELINTDQENNELVPGSTYWMLPDFCTKEPALRK